MNAIQPRRRLAAALSFVDAVAEGIGCSGLRAGLDPDPERCCVTVHDPDRP